MDNIAVTPIDAYWLLYGGKTNLDLCSFSSVMLIGGLGLLKFQTSIVNLEEQKHFTGGWRGRLMREGMDRAYHS